MLLNLDKVPVELHVASTQEVDKTLFLADSDEMNYYFLNIIVYICVTLFLDKKHLFHSLAFYKLLFLLIGLFELVLVEQALFKTSVGVNAMLCGLSGLATFSRFCP